MLILMIQSMCIVESSEESRDSWAAYEVRPNLKSDVSKNIRLF